MTRASARRAFGSAAALFFISCFRESTGPDLRGARLAIAPSFANPYAARRVDFNRVHIVLRRPGSTAIALDTTIAVPPGDTIELTVEVPVSGTEEQFSLTMELLDPAGNPVFRAGPMPVTASSNPYRASTTAPVLQYVGVGSNAAGVRFVNPPVTGFFGATVAVVAEAFDAGGAPIAGTPIEYHLMNPADSARARIPDDGVGQVVLGQQRGSVGIQARLLTNQTATHALLVQPLPSAIRVEAGNGQSGPAGGTLGAITAKVTAADGGGVQDVMVSFAVTAGGGSLSQTQGTTNANGDASAVWTLGGLLGSGAQTVSAGAVGVTGSVSFAATAIAGPAARLVFAQEPTTVNEAAVITPAVTVQALDAFANVVTGFTGTVTLAIGTNPGGGTLGGTATRAAVSGVATFDDLTIAMAGSGYTLAATSGALAPATSAAFDVITATPVALQFQVEPSNAAAGALITPAVQVRLVTLSGATATTATNPVTIAIASNPGGGTLGGTLTVNAVAGIATFSDLSVDRTATGYTLSAAATGLTGATSGPFDVTPGAPQTLQFTVAPSAATAGAGIAPAIEVTARDAQGNVATGFTGNVTLGFGANPGGATLSGTTVVAAVAGVATFANVSLDRAATGYTLSATATGLSSTTSSAFAVTPAAASVLVFTAQPSPTVAGASLAPAVTVTAFDAFGNPATAFTGNVTVAIGANPGGATLTGTASVAAVAGVATFTNLSLDLVGSGYTLAAAATGLTGATSGPFDVTPGAPQTLQFTVAPSAATAGAGIAPAIVVTARDAQGNVATGFTGNIALGLGANPGGATLSGTTVVAAVAGVATFANVSLDKAATGYTLSATATGLSSTTSSAFAVTPAAASVLVFTAQPSPTVAGASLAPAVTVTAFDAFGNPATAFTGNVTVAIGANPGGATLTGTASVAAVAGVATFTNLSLDLVGSGYTLAAAATGLTGAASAPFDITSGAAQTLQFTIPPSAATAGTGIAPAIEVTARDALGNVAASFTGSVTLSFSANPGGATLSGTSVVAAVAGVASFPNVSLDKAAIGYTLIATAAGVSPATSTAFAVGPAAASVLGFTVQPGTTTAGTTVSPSLEVTAFDAFGNVATGFTGNVTVAIGANPGGATLSGTASVAAVAGVATFTSLSMDKAATGYTLGATAAGLSSTTSATFAVAPAAASVLSFTVQPGTAAAGATLTPAVEVTAFDAFGNTATGFTGTVTVAIGTNPGGATLTGTLSVAATAGVATFSDLTLTTQGAGYTLTAGASGLTGSTSASFDITAFTITWTNPAGGSWSNPSNWNLGRVPQPTDSVVIGLAGTYTVTLDTTFTASFLVVGGASGTQTLSLGSRTLAVSGTMTVRSGGVFDLSSSTLAGPGTLANQGIVTLLFSAVNVLLDNQGLLVARGTSTLGGAVTTAAGSTLRVEGVGGSSTGLLTVASGFTNNGAIELTATNSAATAHLAVTAGTLTNAAGGTISALVGAGGPRQLSAELNNLGTVTVSQALTLGRAGAVHGNGGTISVSGGHLTLNQSGTTPSFTNTGTVTIGVGLRWEIFNGTFTQQTGATLSGGGSLEQSFGTMNFNTAFTLGGLFTLAVTMNLGSGVNLSTVGFVTLQLGSTQVNGPGTITNAAGQTLNLVGSNITSTSALDNQGTLLVLDGGSQVNGPLTTTSGSVIRVQGSTGSASLSVPSAGFVNNGAIELTSLCNCSSILQPNAGGSMTNAAGGTITTLAGAGGQRIMQNLDNQGTITVHPGPLSAGVLVVGGNFSTSGTLNMELGGTTAGTGYSQVGVNGAATLGGTLNVTLVGGFTLVSGNTFTIMTSGGATNGSFATTNLPAGVASPPTIVAGPPGSVVLSVP